MSFLNFYCFFQSLILKAIWRFFMNKEVMHFAFFSHEFKLYFMAILGLMLPGWHCGSSLTWDKRFYDIHYRLLISHLLTTVFSSLWTIFLCQKTSHFKRKVGTVLKDFLASKPLEFYHTGINNLVNRWQKCIDV